MNKILTSGNVIGNTFEVFFQALLERPKKLPVPLPSGTLWVKNGPEWTKGRKYMVQTRI